MRGGFIFFFFWGGGKNSAAVGFFGESAVFNAVFCVF